MIQYDVCVAIRELVELAIKARKYVIKHSLLKFGASDADILYNGHQIEIEYDGQIFINKHNHNKIYSVLYVDSCSCINSLYLGNMDDGWMVEMASSILSENDRFFEYTSPDVDSKPQDLMLFDVPKSEEDFDSFIFQLSTIYHPQISSLLMTYMFIRDLVTDGECMIRTSELIFQLSASEIRRITKLMEKQYNLLQVLEKPSYDI